MGVSILFSDVCAVTSPKSPTLTDPSKEKKILDGCIIKGKRKTSFSQMLKNKSPRGLNVDAFFLSL